MTIKEIISHLRKSPKDAWYYVQGNVRYSIYKSKFIFLLSDHIIAQYKERIEGPAAACFLRADCLCCGCETPQLFFSDKACSVDKDKYCQEDGLVQCYGKMKSRKQWQKEKLS